MKIEFTNAKINWMHGFGNEPHLELFTDTDTAEVYNQLVFRAVPCQSGTYYIGQDSDSGLTWFCYHNPKNESGYGGSVFTFKLEDGSIAKVKGPWSSNAFDVNYWLFGSEPEKHLFEVVVRQNGRAVGMCWSLPVSTIQALLQQFLPEQDKEHVKLLLDNGDYPTAHKELWKQKKHFWYQLCWDRLGQKKPLTLEQEEQKAPAEVCGVPQKNLCSVCGAEILGFRDKLSEKEYGISGMCQECQDKVFAEPEDEEDTDNPDNSDQGYNCVR